MPYTMTSPVFDEPAFIIAIVDEFFQGDTENWNPIFTRHYNDVIGLNTEREENILRSYREAVRGEAQILYESLYSHLLNKVDDAIETRYQERDDYYDSGADTDSED
jgi:hypothetical protein